LAERQASEQKLGRQSEYKIYAAELESLLEKRPEMYHSIGEIIVGVLGTAVIVNRGGRLGGIYKIHCYQRLLMRSPTSVEKFKK